MILRGWRQLRRGWSTLALLVAQLSAVGALPALDALLEAQSYDAAPHVEAPETDCASVHDDLYCQLLRSLVHARPAPARSQLRVATRPEYAAGPMPTTRAFTRIQSVGAVGPRAPPIA